MRQRVTHALSQIFVISEKSNLQLSGPGMANYYDLLHQHAFGNFRDLLYDISLHPMMGFYLSHINNPKSYEANNIHPDENYAREIMQLFSIGLFELNPDGTRQLDGNGNPIPTYDNNDIKEFAKIFTGLAPAGYWWPWEDYSFYPPEWGIEYNESPATIVTWESMVRFDLEGTVSVGNKPQVDDKLHLFPNPVSQTLFIDTDIAVKEVIVVDAIGREIIRWTGVTVVDVSGLPAGWYGCRIIGEQQEFMSVSFIKQ